MAHSLEARVPFLDHELVEYAYNVPSAYKTRGYKSLLTAAVSDLVPDRTLERDKHGFDVPVAAWFRDRHPVIERWLAEERLDRTPYLATDTVRGLYESHYRGRTDHAMTLWKVLSYVAWYDEFVASEAP
jgi:asparagine synthase (glutamine-hydrolysing)